MSMEPENYGLNDQSAALEKANVPGILLIVVGALNLLLSLFLVFSAVRSATVTEAELEQQFDEMRKMFPQLTASLPPASEAKTQGMLVYGIWSAISLLGSVLIVLGGVRLRQLRSYGLVLTGAIVAAVPCVSCLGCCLVGEGVGIWALIVAMNDPVRAAFR